MDRAWRNTLGLLPFLLSACGSGEPEAAPRTAAAGSGAAVASSAGTGTGTMMSSAATAMSGSGATGVAGSGTSSRASMSGAGGAAMSGRSTPTPSAAPDDDAGVAAPSGGPIGVEGDDMFTFSISNANVNGVEFAQAQSGQLDCGLTQVDTSDPITFTNWCGTQPKPFIQLQERGPEMVVLPFSDFELVAGNSLLVTGSRSLVLLVRGAVEIGGTIDVSARGAQPGPSGDLVCEGGQGSDGSGRPGLNGGGGGGGGYGTSGGPGGGDSGLGAAAGGGGLERGSSELDPLLGGCAGGQGGGCTSGAGAGGGSIQISASGALTVSGAIQANGGDGADSCESGAGSAGGGSGGSVLLEALRIDVSHAKLEAAGGKGGRARSDAEPSAGSLDAATPGGPGEQGGLLSGGGGGGGGGFGRVRVRAAAANACSGCEKF